jgi:hypothetical protein
MKYFVYIIYKHFKTKWEISIILQSMPYSILYCCYQIFETPFLPVLESGKSKIRVAACSVPGEGVIMLLSSHGERTQKDELTPASFFITSLNPPTRTPPIGCVL